MARLDAGVLALSPPAQVGPDMLGTMGRLVLGLYDPPLLRWVADGESSSCLGCGKGFGMLTRRHHCRRCGVLACARCVGQTGWLVTWLSEEPPHAIKLLLMILQLPEARQCPPNDRVTRFCPLQFGLLLCILWQLITL